MNAHKAQDQGATTYVKEHANESVILSRKILDKRKIQDEMKKQHAKKPERNGHVNVHETSQSMMENEDDEIDWLMHLHNANEEENANENENVNTPVELPAELPVQVQQSDLSRYKLP